MPESLMDKIKELRARTKAGFLDCKKALEEADGDLEKAIKILRLKGAAKAAKLESREAREGTIAAYVHFGGGRIGTLVELNCETDFVARNEEFQALARELAMQIATGAGPKYVSEEDIPPEDLEKEKALLEEAVRKEGKPEHIIPRIVEGRLKKWIQENCLLEQPYFRDPERKVRDLLTEASAKFGEKIQVRRFCRFEIGRD